MYIIQLENLKIDRTITFRSSDLNKVEFFKDVKLILNFGDTTEVIYQDEATSEGLSYLADVFLDILIGKRISENIVTGFIELRVFNVSYLQDK